MPDADTERYDGRPDNESAAELDDDALIGDDHYGDELDGDDLYDEEDLESAYAVDHSGRPAGDPGERAPEYADDEDDYPEEPEPRRGRRSFARLIGRRSGRRSGDVEQDEFPKDGPEDFPDEHPHDSADDFADDSDDDGDDDFGDESGDEVADDATPGGRPRRGMVDDSPGSEDHRDDVDHVDDGDHRDDGDHDDEQPAERPSRVYRPGRGGFDAEGAELIARAKYATRQRLVLFLLVAAIATGLAAGLVLPTLWWGHAAVDLTLVGYLTYLRRQVRIEEAVRQRRLARMGPARSGPANAGPARAPVTREDVDDRSATRRVARPRTVVRPDARAESTAGSIADVAAEADSEPEALGFASNPVPPRVRVPFQHAGATTVELDDEDPAFDELDEPAPISYRRAVGQ